MMRLEMLPRRCVTTQGAGSKLLLLPLLMMILTLERSVYAQTCISFGIDFQDGGSYFQNVLSSQPFTFVSEYEGCNNDTANNVLVAPNGDEWLCTNTPLLPSDTPELSVCPIKKSQLYSGAWSILTISNNGNGGAPIAYERDFNLTVGPQVTVTVTPTVTLSITSTPVSSTTSTSTFVTTSVLNPVTVTSPITTLHPSVTVTPRTSTSTTYKTLATLTLLTNSLEIDQIVRTATASCTLPLKARFTDFKATISPTVITAAAFKTPTPLHSRRFHDRRMALDDLVDEEEERMQLLEGRSKRLHANQKRAPDAPTVTVTDLNTSDYLTITSTSTAAPTTITTVSIITSTTTSTPPPVTTLVGTSTAAVVTVTAPTPIKTLTLLTIGTKYLTVTLTELAIVTTTVTPPAVAASCTSAGGTI